MEEKKSLQSQSKSRGHEGEDEACRFITDLGYRIIKRNFTFGKVGEVDIVAMDGDQLVFIEVKARTNSLSYGKPEDAVDWRKQKQLKRVAEGYYHVNKLFDQACRFDVIAVDKTGGTLEIRHQKTAFY